MTRDAKVGLLLGLLFIFLIALIINGPPGLSRKEDGNALTRQYVRQLRDSSPGLAREQRHAARQIARNESLGKHSTPVMTDDAQPAVRFEMPLPTTSVTFEEPADDRDPPQPQKPAIPAEPQSEAPAKNRLPQRYVVQQGDNLFRIATKFYGPEEGNKRANLRRIYTANRHILDSPDKLLVGQDIVIPPLSSDSHETDSDSLLDSGLFEKVGSIGRKSLQLVTGAPEDTEKYVVKQGDTLWDIAAEQLGDGSRYKDILRLNADLLDNQNTLVTGMSLKLPAR